VNRNSRRIATSYGSRGSVLATQQLVIARQCAEVVATRIGRDNQKPYNASFAAQLLK
jgi:hypothetical protein